MALTIQKATFQDAADMADIHIRSWEAAYSGIIPDEAIAEKNAGRYDMWRDALSGEHESYIARAGDVPVGLMIIHAAYDEDMPMAGELCAIYLVPEAWGKGYGREMMTCALDMLKSRGFDTVTVWVLEANARARKFYEKCGFAFDGTRKEIVIGVPLSEIRYRK